MTKEALVSGTTGGLETFAQAQDVRPADGPGNHHEAEVHESYTVLAIAGAASEETDETGARVASTTTLWVHHRIRREWGFFFYNSDCWAWVTDAKDGGNAVRVDQLEAHLVHDSNFGTNRKTERNASSAHARTRVRGVAVPNPGISGWACAEHSGYDRWCSPTTRA